MSKKKFTIFVDKDTLDNFKDYCRENAFNMPAKLEKFMKEELHKSFLESTFPSFFRFFNRRMAFGTVVKLLPERSSSSK